MSMEMSRFDGVAQVDRHVTVRPFDPESWNRLYSDDKVKALQQAEGLLADAEGRTARTITLWPPSDAASRDAGDRRNTLEAFLYRPTQTLYLNDQFLKANDARTAIAKLVEKDKQTAERFSRGDPPGGGGDPRNEQINALKMQREVVALAMMRMDIKRFEGLREVTRSIQPFNPETWDKLYISDRIDAIAKAERKFAGLQQRSPESVALWPPDPQTARDTKDPRNRPGVRAFYEEEVRCLYFNKYELENADVYQAMGCLFHECRHSAIAQAAGKLEALNQLQSLTASQKEERESLSAMIQEDVKYNAMNEGEEKNETYRKLESERDANRDGELRMRIFCRVAFGPSEI